MRERENKYDEYCKRVYDPAEQSDGYRVLVDRLWPRGIKKTDLALDEWDKKSRRQRARKAFHGEVVDFATFASNILQNWRNTSKKGGWQTSPKTAADPALLSKNTAEPCAGAGKLAT